MATNTKTAAGFINLRIETTNGTKKLSDFGIPLYSDNPIHAKLMQLLEAGTDANDFKQYLQLDYKPNSKLVDPSTVEFGFAPKATASE